MTVVKLINKKVRKSLRERLRPIFLVTIQRTARAVLDQVEDRGIDAISDIRKEIDDLTVEDLD